MFNILLVFYKTNLLTDTYEEISLAETVIELHFSILHIDCSLNRFIRFVET